MSFGQVKALRRGGDGARRLPARPLALGVVFGLLAGCQVLPPEPRVPSAGHVDSQVRQPADDIPPTVGVAPVLPPPVAAPPTETYTVVVNEVPVKELLFALARDAAINVDIHPEISGQVTLNAVDQTLNQILDRIARQIDIHYQIEDATLVISPDRPVLRTYQVDYTNIGRNTTGSVTLATQISTTGSGGEGGGSGGGNNSTTSIDSTSNNQFWNRLVTNVGEIIGAAGTPGRQSAVTDPSVTANPETGLLLVRATNKQHAQVQAYLDKVLASARRQVLIEATIVEVQLSDRYQAGIDWSRISSSLGVTLTQSVLGGFVGTEALLVSASRTNSAGNRVYDLTVRLLKEFGDVRVLSSPKLMTLNNQSAVLKVVENQVYFEVNATVTPATVAGALPVTTIDTDAKTVPVGLVMVVTPQISSSDEVTLNVRPTITRRIGEVRDPQPDLPDGIPNNVPVIAVREMETMLRVNSGQVAILGGLMQDQTSKTRDGVPWLSDLPDIGEAFAFRDNDFSKSELVIFLRPSVIRTPSVGADLQSFQPYLPENLRPAEPLRQISPEPQ